MKKTTRERKRVLIKGGSTQVPHLSRAPRRRNQRSIEEKILLILLLRLRRKRKSLPRRVLREIAKKDLQVVKEVLRKGYQKTNQRKKINKKKKS